MTSSQEIYKASNRVSTTYDISVGLMACATALNKTGDAVRELDGDDVILIAHSLTAFSENLRYVGENLILLAERSVPSEDDYDDCDEPYEDGGFYPEDSFGPFPSSMLQE